MRNEWVYSNNFSWKYSEYYTDYGNIEMSVQWREAIGASVDWRGKIEGLFHEWIQIYKFEVNRKNE